MREPTEDRSGTACDAPTWPAVRALHLAEGVGLCAGADAQAQFLAELGISAAVFADPSARLSFARLSQLIERAVALSGEPALGAVMASQVSISKFGVAGLAALCAPTVREALEVSIRFGPLLTTSCGIRLLVDGALGIIELEENHPLGSAREFLVSELLVAFRLNGALLTGHDLPSRIEFAFPDPGYFERLDPQLRACFVFDQPRHRLVFDVSCLDLPVVTRDPATFRAALAICEQQLLELDPAAFLVQRVRGALFVAESGVVRSAAQVARSLGMAGRTLKRKLAEQGTSYTELLDGQRRTRALELLRSSASIDEIAELLGYSDAANFARAIRRWTGRSPSDVRKVSRAHVGA